MWINGTDKNVAGILPLGFFTIVLYKSLTNEYRTWRRTHEWTWLPDSSGNKREGSVSPRKNWACGKLWILYPLPGIWHWVEICKIPITCVLHEMPDNRKGGSYQGYRCKVRWSSEWGISQYYQYHQLIFFLEKSQKINIKHHFSSSSYSIFCSGSPLFRASLKIPGFFNKHMVIKVYDGFFFQIWHHSSSPDR